jgi:tRNA A-37 threonylcarbamoyl transferase component Bud32
LQAGWGMPGVLALPKPGDVLAGRYVVKERIGEGGMGIVFRADQPALARTVAIKLLHPDLAADEVFTRRFQDEARAASRVRHAGSVAVLDCDVTADGAPFIAMEHVDGRTLGRYLAEREFPLSRVLSITEQILRSLEAAHACGVIHADVKSDNFLIDARPDGDVVTMIDFGLAMIDGEWIDSGFVSGTPEYMAPEVIRGEAPTIASDLYSVGVILYEMLTGAAPFTGASSQEILSRQLEDAPIAPSLRQPDRGIPAGLDAVVLRALHKDPRRRFETAGDFIAALRAVAEVRDLPARVRCQACGALAEAPSGPCRGCGEPVRAEPARRAAGSRTEAPTRNCGSPRRSCSRGPLAGGPSPEELRAVIAGALIRGDAAAIAEGYTELASQLARQKRLDAAIRELEEGIDVLTAGQGPRAAVAAEPVRRLATALAALQRRMCRRAR